MAQTAGPRALVAGNWKMNGLSEPALGELRRLREKLERRPGCEVAVCPPFTLLAPAGEALQGAPVALGGQDCHPEPKGAHTGDIAAEMLADLGCRYVILGHSERRADHGESEAVVRAKTEAAYRAGLTAIVCVGESETERDSGRALAVVEGQIDGSLPDSADAANTVIAYEPVWAIGTGRTPGPPDVGQMHSAVRRQLSRRFSSGEEMRILYGGSVKPDNAGELMAIADVDGALVGGASLTAADFDAILEVYR